MGYSFLLVRYNVCGLAERCARDRGHSGRPGLT
jgi:hypothetical protein